MKISDIRIHVLRYDLPQERWDAHLHIRYRDCMVVEVETDEGITGIGESATFGGASEAVASVICRQLMPLLIGRDPRYARQLWTMMYQSTVHLGRGGIVMAAISGIDIALWDIMGKAAGLPVYQLLGGATSELECYASGGLYGPDLSDGPIVAEVLEYRERGFSAAKLKVGGLGVREDSRRIQAVRSAVGDDFRLMLDANCGFTAGEAIEFSRRVADFGIVWLEEPILADDIDGAVVVAARSAVPIAGYESQTSLFVFRDLITRGAVDVVQADTIWAGGITNVKRIADLADAWHRTFTPHVYTSAIGLAANLHLLASCTNRGLFEFDGQPNPLRDELVTDPIWPDGLAIVRMPEAPGLGVTLNPDAMDRYQLA